MSVCPSCGSNKPPTTSWTCFECGTVLPPAAPPAPTFAPNFPMPIGNPPPPGWNPPPHAQFRTKLAAAPQEQEFLEKLRAHPDDAATRLVYADWLEQHGELAEARLVRGDDVIAGDSLWRAIASRPPIQRCANTACPGRWDQLAARRDDERMRTCGTCEKPVTYVVDEVFLSGLGARREPVCLDAPISVELFDRYYPKR
jgi:uncharacterized protein (TIGR02996 family)